MEAVWGALRELCTVNVLVLAVTGSVLGMIWGLCRGLDGHGHGSSVGVTAKLRLMKRS
jgi:hypothetical protein